MSDPKDIFKKFGPSARHILITSQRIAQNMRSGIGSEHLLIAMTTTAGSLAYDILKDNALSIDQVKLILSLNNIRTNINHGLSQEVKNLLIVAAKKAQQLNSSIIESEHLLWAILANKENRAHQIIGRVGIDIEDLKDQVEEILKDYSDSLKGMPPQIPQGFELFNLDPYSMPANFAMMDPNVQKIAQPSTKKSKTPYLDQFGINLTKLAQEGKLDPVIGRENEINRAIQILSRRTKNNPVLVGEPGIGKTAIVEGLAQKIEKNLIPKSLLGKNIFCLDITMVVAGTMYRGQFEDRIKKILNEVIQNKNIILFIDELHTIIGAGSAEGSMDAANILKPALAKGQIRLIGATTSEEYRKHIEKDAALERRLQVIKVNEPSIDETIKILQGIKEKYQQYHAVRISDSAVMAAAKLSARYISDRHLPDKAIDLIDEAAAAKQISSSFGQSDQEINKLTKKFDEIISKKEKAAEDQNYQLAAELKIQELKTINQLNGLKKKYSSKLKLEINENDIAQIVSMWTSIPMDNLIHTQQKKLLELEKTLNRHIIDQDEAVKTVSQAIRRAKSGIANPARPIGAFIFLGPTGVGKTHLAQTLAHLVFADKNALVKIDMSEFSQKHNVARLIGAPPGYVGYDDAGKLTESVRRQPHSVILMDEIEKAHPEIFNILLQIMEDGYLTDSKGKKVDFRNTIIILTSNIGMQELTRQAAIGFKSSDKDESIKAQEKYEDMKQSVLDQVKNHFRPELLNRLDKIIVFKPLSKSGIEKIVNLQLSELFNRLKDQNIKFDVDNKTRIHLTKVGFNPEFGARPIRRTITDLIENPISDLILSGKVKKGSQITSSLEKDSIKLKIINLKS